MLTILAPQFTTAQNEGSAAFVLELPANTRALGLGNAYVLSGNNPDAIFYNPALLERATGSSFSIQRYAGAATLLSASSSINGFGFGVQAFTYAAVSADLLANPVGFGEIATDNPTAVAELITSIGYGAELFGFQIGIGGKWIQQRVGGARAAGLAADLGVAREIGFLNVGVAIQHVGPDVTVGAIDLPIPMRLGVGLSTDVEQLGPLEVALTTAVFRQHDGGIMAGGGLEVAFWPIAGRTFTGRIGGLHEPHTGKFYFTFGGAIRLDNVTADYAFQDISPAGSGHRASVRWR